MKTKYLIALVLFVLLGTALTACKSSSAVLPPTTIDSVKTKTVEIRLHDTVFQTTKDSSFYKAYIECVNGKPVLSQKVKVESQKGKYVNVPKVNLQNNVLQVDCYAEAQNLFAQWKDTYTKEHIGVSKNIPYPVIQPLSWWQRTQIYCGDFFLLLVALVLIATGLRIAKVI